MKHTPMSTLKSETSTAKPAELRMDATRLHRLSLAEKRELLTRLLHAHIESLSRYPMSAGQQGLWYAFRRDPAMTPFNVYLPARLRGQLDLPALQRSLEFLVQRHACLRTTFADRDAALTQTVHRRFPHHFGIVEAVGWSDERLREVMLAETRRPFDLETGPLLRVFVYRLASDHHVILAITHHIVVDFWSLVLLLRELGDVYRRMAANQDPVLPEAAAEYVDFVRAQQQLEQTEHGQLCREYWREQLRDVPTVLELPTDFERPKQFMGTADVVPLAIEPELAGRVSAFAADHKSTPFAILMAALQVFVRRYAGQTDFVIGTPFSGRSHQRFESTFGFFVNMLPIRARLADSPTFAQLVARVGETLFGALEHQDYPFASIVRELSPTRDPSRSPVFQISCTFEKSHLREERGPAGFLFPSAKIVKDEEGLRQENFYIPQRACRYDMEFVIEQSDDSISGMVCYCTQLFADETIHAMARNFVDLLDSLLTTPEIAVDDCPWRRSHEAPTIHVPAAERPNTTGHRGSAIVAGSEPEPATFLEKIGGTWRESPTAPAMTGQGLRFNYGQTAEIATRVAGRLRSLGVTREQLVPVIGRRGPLSTLGILGVSISGAAFLPLDIDQPAISLQTLQGEIHPRWLVVDTHEHAGNLRDQFPAVCQIVCLEQELEQPPNQADLLATSDLWRSMTQQIRGEDLAYVIFTSGTTGRPKGVMVEHRAIANTLCWRARTVPYSVNDRILMLLSHQFDAGMQLAFASLQDGAHGVWPDVDNSIDLNHVIDVLIREQITVLPATPNLLMALMQQPRFAQCRGLRQVSTGGESVPPDLPARIRSLLPVELWNFYGPTEAAVEATAHCIHSHDSRRRVPLGATVDHMRLQIVDERLRPVPTTVPGELMIAGVGLARGYLDQPEETRRCFPIDPQANTRWYRTGDRVRRLTGGDLEILGRLDRQIKLRGYRLELEEIEHQFGSHPAVREFALVVEGSGPSARLLGFVVGTGIIPDDRLVDEIMQWARQRLAVYKIPSRIVRCPQLPRTAGGKIDRQALIELPHGESDSQPNRESRTPLERELTDLWADQLGWHALQSDSIGLDQNFFELGGTSLQAALLTARLSDRLGIRVPSALLFDLATVSQLARRLAELHPQQITAMFGADSVAKYQLAGAGQTDQALDRGGARNQGTAYSLLSPLHPQGTLPPIFLVHPPGGIVLCYRDLADQLDPDRPLFGIRSRGLHGNEQMPATVEEMAAEYIRALREVWNRGPLVLGGWSLGGIIAYEMAQQLTACGAEVPAILLLDTSIPEEATKLVPTEDRVNVGLEYGIDLSLEQLSQLNAAEQLPYLWQHARNLGVIQDDTPAEVVQQALEDLKILFHHHVQLVNGYRMFPYDGRIILFRPSEVPFARQGSLDRGWSKLARQVEVSVVPGHHHSMVQMPHARALAAEIEAQLASSAT